MAPITSQENDAITQLKMKLQEDFTEENDYNNKNNDITESVLLRFLRDQNMNIDSAETSVRKYLSWRKEVRQKEIRNENMQEKLRELIPLRYGALDKAGRPVFILPVGRWAAELTADMKNSAHFVQYFYLMMDKVVAEINCLQKEGEIELGLGIVDLEHISYKQMQKDVFSVILATVGDMRKYYPEVFYLCSIINAPSGFSLTFKLFKAVLPRRYTDRISIYGRNRNEWISDLQQKISPDQLYKDYGGEYDHKF